MFDSPEARSYKPHTDGDDALGGRLAIWFSRVSRVSNHLTERSGKIGPAFRGRKSALELLLFDN
jgi:hypothetical protein